MILQYYSYYFNCQLLDHYQGLVKEARTIEERKIREKGLRHYEDLVKGYKN